MTTDGASTLTGNYSGVLKKIKDVISDECSGSRLHFIRNVALLPKYWPILGLTGNICTCEAYFTAIMIFVSILSTFNGRQLLSSLSFLHNGRADVRKPFNPAECDWDEYKVACRNYGYALRSFFEEVLHWNVLDFKRLCKMTTNGNAGL